jgi:hypothetical protein
MIFFFSIINRFTIDFNFLSNDLEIKAMEHVDGEHHLAIWKTSDVSGGWNGISILKMVGRME